MPKAEIRDGKLMLPLSDELREKLDVHDGDEFEAHVFAGSVTFTRSSPNARRGEELDDDTGRRSQGSKPLRLLGSRLRVLSRE
jgi:hypothetical protein